MPNFSPRHFGLPFQEWLPNQYEALNLALEALDEALDTHEQRFLVLEMPTGGGKSAIAAALTNRGRVTYLAQTHGLLDQIENNFGFAKVKGKHMFPCVHPEKIAEWAAVKQDQIPLASDCHFNPMSKCEFKDDCEYLQAMRVALASHAMACTPQMAAFHTGIQNRGEIFVIDEAHDLPDTLGGFVNFEINELDLRQYNLPLPPFPGGYGEPNGRGELKGGELSADGTPESWLVVTEWLERCIVRLQSTMTMQNGMNPLMRGHQRFLERLERIAEALPSCPWFLQTGNSVIYNRGRWLGGLILRPLTVTRLAPRLWREANLVVFMSATIGDPAPLMKELGVENYAFASFPHPIPVEARKIYDLGFARMTHANLTENPNLYRLQTLQIGRAIRSMPQEWRGMILTGSYKKINEIKANFPADLQHRLWEPPREAAIGARLQAFIEDRTPGLIHVETLAGAGTGFDGRNDILRWVIIAGVNHPDPTDAYTNARKKYNAGLITQQVFLDVIQAAGRPARSEQRKYMSPEVQNLFRPYDFTPEGYLISRIFIADGSAMSPMAKKYYEKTKWFMEAVTPFKSP